MEYLKLINSLFEIDQHLRKTKSISREINREFDKVTTAIIENIIEEIGYPTISKVGKDESYHFGLMIQHSPNMELVEKLKNIVVENKDVLDDIDKKVIPLWIDKININKKGTQLFGTSFSAERNDKGQVIVKIGRAHV